MMIEVYKISMSSPDDISGLKTFIEDGRIKPQEILSILGKTEGNGCVNDFTRALAASTFQGYLAKVLGIPEMEIKKRIAFVMSGGTEGVMSPHITVFCKREVKAVENHEKALAASVGFTRDFLPEEVGTVIMVNEVKRVVLDLIREACIDSSSDVHFVQIKCPLLTTDRIIDAKSRNKTVAIDDTYKSMGYSRGASALGVAVALGEVDASMVTNSVIGNDFSLYSEVASTSAGIELMNCEILLLGNSKKSISNYRIGHSVMKDAIDLEAVVKAIIDAGLPVKKLPTERQKSRIVNILAKAEADPSGRVRGKRHTMMTDSDINHTRHARAAVNGVIAAVVGDPMVYVSGGAEHQGPAGGGPVAAIIRK